MKFVNVFNFSCFIGSHTDDADVDKSLCSTKSSNRSCPFCAYCRMSFFAFSGTTVDDVKVLSGDGPMKGLPLITSIVY